MERFKKFEAKLSETFKALSLDALTKNTGEFKNTPMRLSNLPKKK
jgi:hypothetical protein